MQTFTEKRETSWAFMPHSGGEIDGPRYGTAPRPWDIAAEPTDIFRNEIKVLQVPHTASVKQCHRCRGAGSLLCQECHGKGWTRCLSCHGDGWGSDSAGNKERCFFCQSSTHGRGRQVRFIVHHRHRPPFIWGITTDVIYHLIYVIILARLS